MTARPALCVQRAVMLSTPLPRRHGAERAGNDGGRMKCRATKTVLLLVSIDLQHAFKVEHYPKGIHTLPADLAALCLRNKWAKEVKP